MQAIRIHQFGGPEVLKLDEVPEPQAGAGQVVIAVRSIGVNPFETYMRAGTYGPQKFPFTPGLDAAGVVETVGADVTGVKPGDRAYTYGAIGGSYAQKVLANDSRVRMLPEHVSFSQGAAMGVPYGTAYRALFDRAVAQPGQTVLVHGASGGVGSAAVQIGRAAGMIMIGTAGTDAGRKLVARQGARHVLDHKDPAHFQQLMDLTGGKGVDVILEMLANVNLANDLTVLAKSGRVVVIGSRGPIEIDPRHTMSRDADIRGMSLHNASEADLNRIHSALVAGLECRILNPVIDTEIPLAKAAEAQIKVMEGGTMGKVVLVV